MTQGKETIDEAVIRVTCHLSGDVAYATSPENAIEAAFQMERDLGRRTGYLAFTFANDLTGETIAVVDGSQLYVAAKAAGR